MFQPVSLFIGLRYMHGRATDKFGRFVSKLSAIGITLGVMALITVLSVMNGFEKGLESNMLGFMPQAVVTGKLGQLSPTDNPAQQLSSLKGVKQVTPLTSGDVVLQSSGSIGVGVMLGIDPDIDDPLTDFTLGARQAHLNAGSYNVIVGHGLAMQLGLEIGSDLRIMVPSASQLTPMWRIPSQRIFHVIGLFNANSDVDDYQILVNIKDASRLMRYRGDNISGWRLHLDNPLQIDALASQSLPQGLTLTDWRDRKGELFQAVGMEKKMMSLLLSLIMAVAAFNIITSLGLSVMEKQSEVAILKTQGLTRRQIMMIFMIQGAGAGIIGAAIGALLGVLLASHLDSILPFIGILIDGASLPVLIEPLHVIGIMCGAMSLALLATIYPSWRAAALQPAQALRYE